MKCKILLMTCLIMGLFVASCDSSSDSCSDIKDGLSYYEYLDEAQQYVSKGDKEKAICALQKALKIEPNDAETHFILGRLYCRRYRNWRSH